MWGIFIDPTVKTARTARGYRAAATIVAARRSYLSTFSRSAEAHAPAHSTALSRTTGSLRYLTIHLGVLIWAIYRRHRYSWKKAVRYGTTSL